MSFSSKDDDLIKFERFLQKQKIEEEALKHGYTPRGAPPEEPSSELKKKLAEFQHTAGGDLASDPDWAKFQKFLKQQDEEGPAVPNDSGQGEMSVLPVELIGLNWAACILNVIWGAIMKVPTMSLLGWTFLLMVPFVGMIFPFYLLFKGNEIAWKSRKWQSIDEFRAVQKKWTTVSLALGGIILILLIALMIFVYSTISQLFRV